jgi:hypothetical protein
MGRAKASTKDAVEIILNLRALYEEDLGSLTTLFAALALALRFSKGIVDPLRGAVRWPRRSRAATCP